MDFQNPDFVKYAESMHAKGYRVEKAEDLLPILEVMKGIMGAAALQMFTSAVYSVM